jgi:hypothetical protein
MRPLVTRCHLGLGMLYRLTGDGAKAEEHLTTARAMYQEMDMRPAQLGEGTLQTCERRIEHGSELAELVLGILDRQTLSEPVGCDTSSAFGHAADRSRRSPREAEAAQVASPRASGSPSASIRSSSRSSWRNGSSDRTTRRTIGTPPHGVRRGEHSDASVPP